jgi:hypothetical protein
MKHKSITDIAFEPDTAEVVYWLSDETNNAILRQGARLGICAEEVRVIRDEIVDLSNKAHQSNHY